MIRVLHIVHALTRGGGLSNFLMNYYRVIDRTQIQFDFIYFREVENDFKDEITALGGKYYKLTEPMLNFKYIREREKFFRKHQGEYAVLHCHALFAAAVYANTAKKHGVRNIIAHSHSVGYGVGLFRKMRNLYFIKQANRLATRKMACSEDAAVFMFGRKALGDGEVTVINNAIDCNKYYFDKAVRESVRQELDLGNSFVVGHVGGFTDLKNHDFLIDVFAAICRRWPDSILLLVGGNGIASGSTRKLIERKVMSYGLINRVRFLGIRRDVNRLMAAMDVFVFPSIFEGFGLALVEAQAAGLPCFASEAVPNDTKLSGKITYLPLDAGAEKWAEAIVKFVYEENTCRKVDSDRFFRYDIEQSVNLIMNIYSSMGNTCG